MPTAPNAPLLLATCVANAALATDRRPGEYMASLNAAVVASRPTGKTVVAKPPGIPAIYQWSKSTDMAGTTYTNIPGATSNSFSVVVDLPDDHFYYRVRVSLPAGVNPTATTFQLDAGHFGEVNVHQNDIRLLGNNVLQTFF